MVIPRLDILKYFKFHLFLRFKPGAINQLALEGLEETLGNSVVPAIAFPAHALHNIMVFQQINGLLASVLNAPVGMKDHSLAERPSPVCHPDSRESRLGGTQAITDRPADKLAVEKVDHAREVQETILAGDVRDIGHARHRRAVPIEVPVQQVGCHTMIVGSIRRHLETLRELASQPHRLHVAGHGSPRNGYPGSLQVLRQPGTAVATLGLEIGVPDLFTEFHLFPRPLAKRLLQPTIITATRYAQYPAHHLDRPFPRVVILYEHEYQRSLVEMMPKAFFNMSRSVSASFRRFSRSATRSASPPWKRTPFPGKLPSPFSWYSLRQRYSRAGEIPSSCASSETFFRSRLSLTAFSLNALS
jgi:hypothetical protein